MRGESPTLPGRFIVMPPVEVAVVIRPVLSYATHPTVSCPKPTSGFGALPLENKSVTVWVYPFASGVLYLCWVVCGVWYGVACYVLRVNTSSGGELGFISSLLRLV
jgi:hypothetical protein